MEESTSSTTTSPEDSKTVEEPTTTVEPTTRTEEATSAPSPVQPEPMPAAAPVPGVQHAVSQGMNGPLPDELRHWNWGAFLLNWIWGISHNVWISLLMFVPIVQIGVPFYLGAKGNELAWEHRKFESVDQFKEVERKWTGWGIGIFIAQIVIFFMTWSIIMALVIGIFASSSDSTSSINSSSVDTFQTN